MNKYFLLFVFSLLILRLNGQTEKNNLSLNDAIDIALKQNPELIAARENIIGAKGRFWKGISLPSPEVEWIAEFIPSGGSLSNYSEGTLAISQAFEFPTNYFLKGSKFSKEEESAVQHYSLKERQIIAEVKAAYYKKLAKQTLVNYAEENLSISEEFFRKAQIRYNVGEGTNIEQLTAKVQLSEAKNKLEIAINELKTSSAELNYSLGYGNDAYASVFSLTDSLVYKEYTIVLDDIYTLTDSINPNIQIAKLNNSIASVEKSIAWSSLLPNFRVAYFKQSRDGINDFYGGSLGVSVPLWFLFDQRGAIQEASANESISDAILIQTKNETSLLAKNAFTEYTNNKQQLKIYIEDILPQAEEVYRTAIKSYDAGELSYLEFMQSKQMLINAQENSVNALFNYYKSIASLEEIIGINLNELEN